VSDTRTPTATDESKTDFRRALDVIDAVNKAGGTLAFTDLLDLIADVRTDERERIATSVENHCCVSSCCDWQPGNEAKTLAACIRRSRGMS